MRYFFVFLMLAMPAVAQQQPDFQKIVEREFGASFKVETAFPPLLGDLDGDGQEDAVLVASSRAPLEDEAEFHYKAIDPYDGYFGFGDAKITVQFTATSGGPTRYVLIIHHWKAPAAKFVMLNLPFDQLSLGHITRKKKKLTTIRAVEPGDLTADVFWDGKKYRWEPAYLGK